MEIERTPVTDSSTIVSHGYDPDTETMHVEFKSGGLYEVREFPQEKATEFADHCSDPSKSGGSYYARNVRDQYPVTKIG